MAISSLAPHPRLVMGARAPRLGRIRGWPNLAEAISRVRRDADAFLAGTTFDYRATQHNAHLIRARTMQRRVVTLLAAWTVTGSLLMRAIPMELQVAPGGCVAGKVADGRVFDSFEQARDAIRALREREGLPPGGIVVRVEAGIYELDHSFVLEPCDSGAPGKPIVYRAAPSAVCRLVGGCAISGFAPVADPAMLARLPENARERVRQTSLPAQGVTNFGALQLSGFAIPDKPAPLELFYGGRPMPLAGWPDEGWATIADVPPGKPFIDESGVERGTSVDGFIYAGDRPARWTNAPGAWLHGFWSYDWADTYLPLQSIDPVQRRIRVAAPPDHFGYKRGQRWRALNLLEELDTPGEWYLDRATGILYFWPPDDGTGANTAMVSIMEEPLVVLREVSHVAFEGLTIECGRGVGVRIEGGAEIVLGGCVLRNLGGSGVVIAGGRRHRVDGCDLHDLGASGIIMQGGDRQTLAPAGHVVRNNHIHHYARWCRSLRVGIMMQGVGLEASHNRIHDAPHTAILFKGNDHLVEFNHIYRVVRQTGDAGAIYTGRDWTMRGNVVRHNYIHDTPSVVGVGSMGVYLDDLTSGVRVEGNIFVNAGRAVLIGGGRDNRVLNNIFIACQTAVHLDARGLTWANARILGRRGSWDLFGKLEAMLFEGSPYSGKYPELAQMSDDEPLQPRHNVIRRNIRAGRGKWLELYGVQKRIIDLADNFVKGAAGFTAADPAQAGFALKPESPALRMGFVSIPFDRIGLQREGYRARVPPAQ